MQSPAGPPTLHLLRWPGGGFLVPWRLLVPAPLLRPGNVGDGWFPGRALYQT